MSRFDLDFLGNNLWLTIVLCLVLLGLSFLYYRRTTPPLPPILRWFLLILRSLAFLGLFLALAQPILSYTRVIQQKKQMAVLLDRSGSMQLPNSAQSDETRLQMAENVLDGSEMAPVRDSLDLTVFAFAESLDVSDQGLNLTGNKTDFGRALQQLREASGINPPDYILLVSDGRATEGEDLPDMAASLGIPVYAVAVGDSSRTDDIALTDIEFNDVVYAGRKTEIKAIISQQGNIAGRMQISLAEGDRVLTQKTDDPPGDGKSGEYVLNLTPEKPGKMFLNINISAGDETNTLNNRRTFAIKVLKSKLNILVYSSSVNQEYAFLNRYLESRDDYEVTRVIDAPGGNRLGERFPNTQEKLNSFDLVIMIDPDLSRLSSHYDRLLSYMTDRGGAIMVFMGEEYVGSVDGNRVETLSPLAVASLRTQPIRYGKFHIIPDARMVFHPVLKLAETREDIMAAWANQPPFTQSLAVDSVRTGGVSLGYLEEADDHSRTTAIAFKRYGAGKLLASSVMPFWHWAFYPIGVGGDASAYHEFLSGTIRWLTISDESDRITFKPVKEVFESGEEAAFEGFIRDEGFRPIENAAGDLIVTSRSGDTTIARILPDPARPGKYTASAGALTPGSYAYHAEINADSVRLGTFDGEFAIDDIDRETAFSDVDWTNLAMAARISGGMFASYHNIGPLVEGIDMEATEIEETHDIRLWDNLALLIIIILTLSLEWFVRKRRQLL